MHIEKSKQAFIVFILILCFFQALAQETSRLKKPRLQVIQLGFGSRIFELEEFGNNPTTLAPLMKDPITYKKFIQSQNYNGISGNGGAITVVPQHGILLELTKTNTASRFWKRYRVQTGIFLTNRLGKRGMGLFKEGLATDSTFYRNAYTIARSIQFAGTSIGINRRLRISPKVNFLTGLHANLLCAVRHSYTQQFDSTSVNIRQGTSISKSFPLPNLKGRNFTEWQLLLPLALEIDVYKKTWFVRPELYVGIISGKYRKHYQSRINEGHGAGVSAVYMVRR